MSGALTRTQHETFYVLPHLDYQGRLTTLAAQHEKNENVKHDPGYLDLGRMFGEGGEPGG